MGEKVKVIENCYCGYCMSDNVRRIERFQGKDVVPDDKYNDSNTGIVVECLDCEEITGFLVILTGVVNEDVEE